MNLLFCLIDVLLLNENLDQMRFWSYKICRFKGIFPPTFEIITFEVIPTFDLKTGKLISPIKFHKKCDGCVWKLLNFSKNKEIVENLDYKKKVLVSILASFVKFCERMWNKNKKIL